MKIAPELYKEAKKYVVLMSHASTSALQRKFKIGYNAACQILKMLEKDRVVGRETCQPAVVIDNISLGDFSCAACLGSRLCGKCLGSGRVDAVTKLAERPLWFKKYKATGDLEIRNKILLRFAPVVRAVARQMARNRYLNIEYERLVGIGTLGLIDAIDKFQTRDRISFKTFAHTHISSVILEELSETTRRNIMGLYWESIGNLKRVRTKRRRCGNCHGYRICPRCLGRSKLVRKS